MHLRCGIALAAAAVAASQKIPDQDWGYVDVRAQAHMFWWLYGANATTPREQMPIFLWLQGGPGGSSSGFGNFMELGTLDVNLQYRNTTWTQVANVLFIDQPVGTGWSYVDDQSAYATNNSQLSADVVTLLTAFTSKYSIATTLPFFIFCESYGGKMTTGVAQAILAAVSGGSLKLNLRGIALGDSWISPVDYVQAWGPFLQSVSTLDARDLAEYTSGPVAAVNAAIAKGDWVGATHAWGQAENVIGDLSDGTDFYNILLQDDSGSGVRREVPLSDSAAALAPAGMNRAILTRLYNRHVVRPYGVSLGDPLSDLMNGLIRTHLNGGPAGKVIPDSVTWGGQSDAVFTALSGDFMRPIVDGVDALLQGGAINVTVYTGQLDLICCTVGTEAWMSKLTWAGMADFYGAKKVPHYPSAGAETGGFRKSAENGLTMWYVLRAGHMVPSDNGPTALLMVRDILARQA